MCIRVSLLILLAALCSQSKVALAACETTELPFQPYSSSYLPKKEGRLTNPNSNPNRSDARPEIEMTKEQAENWSKQTLMQKLDSLNEYILGKKTNYQESVERSHHDSSRPDWEGHCHIWSNASLDPEVNEYIKNAPNATLCGNTVITKGEIKEMFTGFYPEGENGWTGTRFDHALSDEEKASFSDHGDPYSAGSFDEHIQSSLKSGKGAVINITKAAEVWNQPAYRSDRCETPKPMTQELVGKMNPCLLQARDKDVNLWLRDLCDTNGLTMYRTSYNALRESPDLKDNARGVALQLEVLSSKLSMRGSRPSYANDARAAAQRVQEEQGSLTAATQASRALIQNLAKAGEIHPADLGLTAIEVKNTVTYGSETTYARPETMSSNSRYDYVLFKNADGKVVGSEWETDIKQRPGFVWNPQKAKKSTWGKPLRDLLEVLDRCREFPEFATQNKETLKALHEAIRGASAPM